MKKNLILFSSRVSLVLTLFLMTLLLLRTVSAVGTYPAVDPNMVLYYHFNNDVVDYSNSHLANGTVYNLTYNSTGGYLKDGDYLFNGSSYINISNSSYLNLKDKSFTINFWIKPSNISYLQMVYSSLTNASDKDTRIFLQSGGVLRFDYEVADGGERTTDLTVPLNISQYVMITIVYSNDISNTTSLFIDGLLNKRQTNAYKLRFLNQEKYIGGNPNSKFNGSLDEFIIYNKSLSDGEINDLYLTYHGCYSSPEIYDKISISRSGKLTLCRDSYLFNGSVTGSFRFLTSNIYFDCNNSLIYGNYTTNSRAFQSYYALSNNTIVNCNISNYPYAIDILYNNNFSLINSNIYYSMRSLITQSNYSLIHNNSFLYSFSDYGVIYLDYNNSFTNISDNIFYYTVNSSVFLYSVDYGYQYKTYVGYNIFNDTESNHAIKFSGWSINTTIDNNIFDGIFGYSVRFYKHIYSVLSDNIHFNRGFQFENGNNTYIFNDTFNRNNFNVYFLNETNLTIMYSRFINNNSRYGIQLLDLKYLQFLYNNISFFSMGVDLRNCSYCNLSYNFVVNSTYGNDGWDTGISVFNSTYINLMNNSILDYGSLGILIKKSSYVNVFNNSFLKSTLYNRLKNNSTYYMDIDEPSCAISSLELYKKWLGDAREKATDNITVISEYKSTNVSIINNKFSSYDDCFGFFQGTINLFTDFSDLNSWYKSFQIPSYLLDKSEFFVSNLFNNLTNINWSSNKNNVFYQGYRNSFYSRYVGYSVFKNYLYFFNSNLTQDYLVNVYNSSNSVLYTKNYMNLSYGQNRTFNFSLDVGNYAYIFNLSNFNNSINFTKALVFYSNGSVQNSLDLSSNNGLLNIIFNSSSNLTYVFDNFNCSESAQSSTGFPCGRENSPIWFDSSSNLSRKVIVSTLSDILYNLTVNFNVANCLANYSLKYYPVNGVPFQVILANGSCNNVTNSVTGLLDIYPSIYDTVHTYVCTRIRNDSQVLAHTFINGSGLSPYHYYSESGCTGFTGNYCSTALFSSSNYTLIRSDSSMKVPSWAQNNLTCLFSYWNQSLNDYMMVMAWRVSGFGGQFCNVQNQWDFYNYISGDGGYSINLSSSVLNNFSFYELDCVQSNNNSYDKFDIIPFVPSPGPNSPNVFPDFFKIDFTKSIYLALLWIFFIIICLLLYNHFFAFAGFLTIIIGFILLFSGVSPILSFLIIIMGVLMVMTFEK